MLSSAEMLRISFEALLRVRRGAVVCISCILTQKSQPGPSPDWEMQPSPIWGMVAA